jgi:hypothetical protein
MISTIIIIADKLIPAPVNIPQTHVRCASDLLHASVAKLVTSFKPITPKIMATAIPMIINKIKIINFFTSLLYKIKITSFYYE